MSILMFLPHIIGVVPSHLLLSLIDRNQHLMYPADMPIHYDYRIWRSDK